MNETVTVCNELGLTQLGPHSWSQRHRLVRPLQSSSTRHFLRHVFSGFCLRSWHPVTLAIRARKWLGIRRAPCLFLPRFLPASTSARSHQHNHLQRYWCVRATKLFWLPRQMLSSGSWTVTLSNSQANRIYLYFSLIFCLVPKLAPVSFGRTWFKLNLINGRIWPKCIIFWT